jgi:hypothetical protein
VEGEREKQKKTEKNKKKRSVGLSVQMEETFEGKADVRRSPELGEQ